MLAVSVAVLKAVVFPLTEVSAVLPFTPLVWSQARNVKPGSTVPLKFRLGIKRTRVAALDASNLAVFPLGLPNPLQFGPFSIQNFQTPFVLSTAVTSLPSTPPQ